MTKITRFTIEVDTAIKPLLSNDGSEFVDVTELVERAVHEAIYKKIHSLVMEDDNSDFEDAVIDEVWERTSVGVQTLGELGEINLKITAPSDLEDPE
jgi:hypothetical protein